VSVIGHVGHVRKLSGQNLEPAPTTLRPDCNGLERSDHGQDSIDWFAAVRPDGRPHLTPIWFVWVDDRIWVCTQNNTVKVRNVQANPNVSIALEDGNAPITGEGMAVVRLRTDAPSAVRDAFIQKYRWDIDSDTAGYSVVIEITIAKWLNPGEAVVT
jgi:F420H(2)-dependent biliverdin reductase